MSKQSETKAKQNYRPKAVPRNCGNCSQFLCDRVQVRPPSDLSEYGWWEEKNLRCAIGGFAVKKGGACDEFTRKETE